MRIEISDHAADRYRERFGMGMTLAGAREAIRSVLPSARRIHAQGSDRALFEVAAPPIRLVIKNPDTRDAVVLTVLPVVDAETSDDGAESRPAHVTNRTPQLAVAERLVSDWIRMLPRAAKRELRDRHFAALIARITTALGESGATEGKAAE